MVSHLWTCEKSLAGHINVHKSLQGLYSYLEEVQRFGQMYISKQSRLVLDFKCRMGGAGEALLSAQKSKPARQYSLSAKRWRSKVHVTATTAGEDASAVFGS